MLVRVHLSNPFYLPPDPPLPFRRPPPREEGGSRNTAKERRVNYFRKAFSHYCKMSLPHPPEHMMSMATSGTGPVKAGSVLGVKYLRVWSAGTPSWIS